VQRARLSRSLICLAAACVVTACGSASVGALPTPMVGGQVGDVAPALTGMSIEGHALSLSGWRGSVIVVLFWRSYCAPCQAEQPAVNSLARELMPSGMHFAGISLDLVRSAAQSYAVRFGVPYDSLIDPNWSLAYDFGVDAMPWTFVIGRSGHVAAEFVGPLDIPTLRADIATAQAGP
jgi:peroxiredoxin